MKDVNELQKELIAIQIRANERLATIRRYNQLIKDMENVVSNFISRSLNGEKEMVESIKKTVSALLDTIDDTFVAEYNKLYDKELVLEEALQGDRQLALFDNDKSS